MGCSHREGCPLFPLLNASLRGWRDYYCDHADRWHDCARYKVSLSGRPMPITLLPSGYDAQYLTDRAAAAKPSQVPGQAPPQPLFNSRPPQTTEPVSWFEPVKTPTPAWPFESASPAPARPFEPAPRAPARPFEPAPLAYVPQPPVSPPAESTRPAPRAPGSIRHWWTRLSDWMTGPA